MQISNKNVKAGTLFFDGIDKDGNIVTSFYPLKINDDGSADEIFYSYVDADVDIHGYAEREDIADFEIDGIKYIAFVKTITTYSVELTRGWNTWWLSNIRNEKEFKYTNKWSTASISILKWYSFEDRCELGWW